MFFKERKLSFCSLKDTFLVALASSLNIGCGVENITSCGPIPAIKVCGNWVTEIKDRNTQGSRD